jgi:putative PIN family toxin of toxin-antitoxin system
LLSAQGSPAKIIDYWEAEWYDVATSDILLGELERAIGYERVRKYFKQSQEKITTLLKRFRTVGIMVDPKQDLNVIRDDPDDNRVIECAVTAKAKFIVSGDEHLLRLKEYRGIVILSPTGFVTLLELESKHD